MRLIAIDGAAAQVSLCLWQDRRILGDWESSRPQPGRVMEALKGLLHEADLGFGDFDAVAFGRGPGAFTGVRLAVALAQGIGLGGNLALVAVPDLAALAWRAHQVYGWERIVAAMDARQGEIYWAHYEWSGQAPVSRSNERIDRIAGVAPAPGTWAGAGSGALLLNHAGLSFAAMDADLVPDAAAVARLGAFELAAGHTLKAEQAGPVYLRDRVAEPRSCKRHKPSVN